MLNRAVSAIRKGITKKSSKTSAKQSNASDDDDESIISSVSVDSSLSGIGSVTGGGAGGAAAPAIIKSLNSIEGDYELYILPPNFTALLIENEHIIIILLSVIGISTNTINKLCTLLYGCTGFSMRLPIVDMTRLFLF